MLTQDVLINTLNLSGRKIDRRAMLTGEKLTNTDSDYLYSSYSHSCISDIRKKTRD